MAHKKKDLPLLESIEISSIAGEGKAIAKYNDMIVFTQYAVPGDVVDIQISKKRHNYMEGRIVNYISYSPRREKPFCKHYGICGGCKWQILPYADQLKYKQKQVEDNLKRIGHLEFPPLHPILGSIKTIYYRNKLEFTFSNKKWLTTEQIKSNEEVEDFNALGFHIPGKFDKVLDIDHCFLQNELSDTIRRHIRTFACQHKMPFMDIRNKEGLLRNLIIRTNQAGQVMVIIVFYHDEPEERELLLKDLADKFPQIISLYYYINEKSNDTLTDQIPQLFRGQPFIEEEMEGLRFNIGPKSFYQTNTLQAYELYKVARNFANLSGQELVYDLYTGTGTIACFVAKQACRVIGIEYVEEAIEDAKINAEKNHINNTEFYAGDMKDILTLEFLAKHGKPDVIITDPPREGMHVDVVNVILQASPKRIVYVSCNPATQARDLQLLCTDYEIDAVQPVDMFPHTQHVENVVLLNKKKTLD